MPSSQHGGKAHLVRLASPLIMPLIVACASSERPEPTPVPTLAHTAGAQREFALLENRWRSTASSQRFQLDADLELFLARHGGEPIADRVRILLAWNALERDDSARAQRHLAPVLARPAGASRDAATVAAAALSLRRNQPARALALLEPLDGKLIDPTELAQYREQLALAAVESHHWETAMSAMQVWLAEAPSHEQTRVRERSIKLLEHFPAREVKTQLRLLQQRIGSVPEGATDLESARWLAAALERRLVALALHQRDAVLAKQLVDEGVYARSRSNGAALRELASEADVSPRIQGRTIGLALTVSGPEQRRLASAAVEGLMAALGIPGEDSGTGQFRLLVREIEDPSRTARTLNALAGEGAGILVAGTDAETTNLALRYAARDAAPLLLLMRPSEPLPVGMPVFSVGLPAKAEELTASSALVKEGAEQAAFVGLGGPCDSYEKGTLNRFPIAEWRRNEVDAVVALGPLECTRVLIRELEAASMNPRILFGLQSGSLYGSSAWAGESSWLGAGHFPLAAQSDLPPELAHRDTTWGWYQSLGYDVGTLAKAALNALPAVRAEDRGEVAEFHRRTDAALRSTDVALITSHSRGFSPQQVIERTVEPVARKER